jgi:hypothetical protein
MSLIIVMSKFMWLSTHESETPAQKLGRRHRVIDFCVGYVKRCRPPTKITNLKERKPRCTAPHCSTLSSLEYNL